MASKCDSGRGQGDGCPRVRQGRRDAGGSRCFGWGWGSSWCPQQGGGTLRVAGGSLAVVKALRSRAGWAGDSCALPPWQPRLCPSALIPAGAASACASPARCQPPRLCHQLCLPPSPCRHSSCAALCRCHHQHRDTPALQTPLDDARGTWQRNWDVTTSVTPQSLPGQVSGDRR